MPDLDYPDTGQRDDRRKKKAREGRAKGRKERKESEQQMTDQARRAVGLGASEPRSVDIW